MTPILTLTKEERRAKREARREARKGTGFDVYVANVPVGETVIPIERLKDIAVKKTKARFRAPNDNARQVRNLIEFESGESEKGEIFYTLEDVKDYLQLTIDAHELRLAEEQADLEAFKTYIELL